MNEAIGGISRTTSRTRRARVLAVLAVLAAGSTADVSRAGFGVPAQEQAPEPPDSPTDDGPARRYGGLDRESCEKMLAARGVPFARVDEARGVLAPVRLTGPVHGVVYRTALPEPKRASSPWEIVDCRLALALDDFAGQLAAHDIVEVVHFSAYRPPSPRWPAGRAAKRHPGALAIDAAEFIKRDQTKLSIERDFRGRIGAMTCGPRAAHPTTPAAVELRQIVCDAADAKLFNVELTPDFNWAHRNHLHLEVTAGVPWFFVR
jgi:hypothetical protein